MDLTELAMLLETTQGQKVDWDEFADAAARLSRQRGLDDSQKLQLYGLYKQGNLATSISFSLLNTYS